MHATTEKRHVPANELAIYLLDLDTPPSINRIWRHGRGRTYISPEYKRWRHEADMAALIQRVIPKRMILGWFSAHISIGPGRADLDNVATKALLDWCELRGYIANDKNCASIRIQRVSQALAPRGCRLLLVELAQ